MSLSNNRILLLATAIVLAGCSSSSSTPGASDDPTVNDNSGAQAENTGAEIADGGATADGDTTAVTDNDAVVPASLNPDNADAVIRQAFEVLTGRAYDQRLLAFPYVTPVEIETRQRYLPLECQNAGVVTQTQMSDVGRFSNDSFYVDCQIGGFGGDVINGRVLFDEDFYCCDYFRHFSEDFTVNFEPGGVMELAGRYAYDPSLGSKRTVGVTDFNYHFTYRGGTLTVSNATTLRAFRLDGRSDENNNFSSMTGAFSMIAPVLEGISIDVSVTEDFINTQTPSQLAYERGRLQIAASDSMIALDANTGDQNTVEVSITSNSGSTVTTIKNWSTWRDALSFVPPKLSGNEKQPPSDGDGSVINESTYKNVLSDVFAVFTGKLFGSTILALPNYPEPDFPAGFLAQTAPDGLGDTTLQACTNGGSAALTPYKFGYRQITSGWDFNFTNCEYKAKIYYGSFKTRDFGNFFYQAKGFGISADSTSTSFSGSLDYKYRSNRDGGPSRHYNLDSVNYFSDDAGVDGRGSLRAASFTYNVSAPYSAGMSGSFSFLSAATGGIIVNVTTADPLVSVLQGNPSNDKPPITYFQSGLLVIDAGNNNTLELNPSTGDPLTFEVSVFQPNREPFKVIENWQDWRERVAFNYDLKPR